MTTLHDQTVLLVGGRSGIAARIAKSVLTAGGVPVLAGRRPLDTDLRQVRLDLRDETTIAAAAAEMGEVDHVVSLA